MVKDVSRDRVFRYIGLDQPEKYKYIKDKDASQKRDERSMWTIKQKLDMREKDRLRKKKQMLKQQNRVTPAVMRLVLYVSVEPSKMHCGVKKENWKSPLRLM